MKRPHFKTGSIGGNVVPNVKSMDSQREPKACDAILQAVGQRSQLIHEVLVMIQCLQMSRGEEFVSSLPSDKDVRAEQDEATSGAGGHAYYAGGLRGYPSSSGWKGTTVVCLSCER